MGLRYGKQSLRMLVGCVANLPAKHGQIELFLRGFCFKFARYYGFSSHSIAKFLPINSQNQPKIPQICQQQLLFQISFKM